VKILILGADQSKRYNFGHQLFKEEIARQHDVRFYGEGCAGWSPSRTDISAIMNFLNFQPDLLFSYMGKYCKWLTGMDKVRIPKVHLVIDYFPWNYEIENNFIDRCRPDMTLAVYQHEVRAMRKMGIQNPDHLQFSVDTNLLASDGMDRATDVFAVFSSVSWAYPTRSSILAVLEKEVRSHNLSGIVRASWPKTRLMRDDYVQALVHSKITVNGVDVHRSLNWKFFEPCACGSMLLTEEAEDMEPAGFKDNENCVVFNGMEALAERLHFYLDHDFERTRIARAGEKLVRENHSNKIRVTEMFELIRKTIGVGDAG